MSDLEGKPFESWNLQSTSKWETSMPSLYEWVVAVIMVQYVPPGLGITFYVKL